MDHKEKALHKVFRLMCVSMKVVDRQVMPNITGWVKTRALNTRNLGVICLPIRELSSLVYVSCVVYAVRRVSIPPETWHMQ